MRIKQYFEDRGIKKFLKTLSPALKQRYGGSGPYTYGQVQKTIEDLKLDKKYSDFAFFIFCDEDQYEKFGFHLEEVKRYEGYRDRIYGGHCGSCGSSGGEGSCGAGGGD
jgi:Family of unknown function (DUF6559)